MLYNRYKPKLNYTQFSDTFNNFLKICSKYGNKKNLFEISFHQATKQSSSLLRYQTNFF